jgi:hypothetical protein
MVNTECIPVFTVALAQLHKPPSSLDLHDLDAHFISKFDEGIEKNSSVGVNRIQSALCPAVVPLGASRTLCQPGTCALS